MWAHQASVIVLAWLALLFVAPVLAGDITTLADMSGKAMPDVPTLYKVEVPPRHFSTANNPTARSDALAGIPPGSGKTTALSADAQYGLNWTLDGQPPSLEYRFSQSGVVRFRGSRRGVKAVVRWDF